MKDRLARSDWLRHGMVTLAKEGPSGLKVGPMADKLKVSRGSFYWHFRDIADFRAQLLQSWQARTTDQVIQDLEETAEPDRLRRLMRRAFVGKSGLDPAIRAWAAEDAEVASVVAEADASRIAYIAKLLVAAGVKANTARHRAAFLYWAYLGQPIVMDPRHGSIPASAMDDINDMFEK